MGRSTGTLLHIGTRIIGATAPLLLCCLALAGAIFFFLPRQIKSAEANRRRSPTHWFKTRESLVSLLACRRLQIKKDFRQRADCVGGGGAVRARRCKLRSSRCPLCFSFQVIYSSFGGSTKGLHFNNLIVGLVLLTRGRDEEKAKCKLLMHVFENYYIDQRWANSVTCGATVGFQI